MTQALLWALNEYDYPPPPPPLSIPTNDVLPSISGDNIVGGVLTVDDGEWSGNPAPSITRQWRRNGTAIPGATANTYTKTSTDLGTTISCRVTATNSQGTAQADATGSLSIVQPPAVVTNPVITGTGKFGSTLTCTGGTYSGYPAPTVAHQWQRNGVDIPGATADTYVVAAADEGKNITCKNTATSSSGSVVANSNTISVGSFAPAFISSTNGPSTSNAGTGGSFNVTTVAECDCLVFCIGVGTGSNGDIDLTGATFNGVAMTRGGKFSKGLGDTVEIWYLKNPPIGTYSLAFSHPSANRERDCVAIQLKNIGVADHVDTWSGASGKTATLDVRPTKKPSIGIAAVRMWTASEAPGVWSGSVVAPVRVIGRDTVSNGSNRFFGAAYSLFPTQTLVAAGTMKCTGSGSNAENTSGVSVIFTGVAAAP
jgi:hypothetical protein